MTCCDQVQSAMDKKADAENKARDAVAAREEAEADVERYAKQAAAALKNAERMATKAAMLKAEENNALVPHLCILYCV